MNWTGGQGSVPSPTRRSHQNRLLGPHQLVDTDRVLREPRMKIKPPAPGIATLACRCGQVLNHYDMVRAPALLPETGDDIGRVGAIPRIMCINCAAAIRAAARDES